MSPGRNTPSHDPTGGTSGWRAPPPEPLDRPLSPRSVIASLLLGMHPPRLRAALLVRWCRHLGIAEGTTRVALSRMVDAGELTAADGRYELSGPLRDRQASQDWSLTPELRPWHGAWALAVVRPGGRGAPARAQLRAAARSARMVELRDGLWGRPDNLPPEATPPRAAAILAEQATRWSATPSHGDGPDVDSRFELAATAARTRDLDHRLRHVTGGLAAGDLGQLGDSFVVGAAAFRQIRRDPLLPPELTGDGWPTPELRAAYATYQQVFSGAVRAWFAEATAAP